MLSCLPLGTNRVRITDWINTVHPSFAEQHWINYNPVLGRIAAERHVEYELIGDIRALEDLLERHPAARIRNTLSNEPLLTVGETEMIMGKLKTIQEVAAWKRVRDKGTDIIDEFGFHLYIRSDIDFSGTQEDIDLRY